MTHDPKMDSKSELLSYGGEEKQWCKLLNYFLSISHIKLLLSIENILNHTHWRYFLVVFVTVLVFFIIISGKLLITLIISTQKYTLCVCVCISYTRFSVHWPVMFYHFGICLIQFKITDSLVLITKMYFKSQIIILDLCLNASDFSMK